MGGKPLLINGERTVDFVSGEDRMVPPLKELGREGIPKETWKPFIKVKMTRRYLSLIEILINKFALNSGDEEHQADATLFFGWRTDENCNPFIQVNEKFHISFLIYKDFEPIQNYNLLMEEAEPQDNAESMDFDDRSQRSRRDILDKYYDWWCFHLGWFCGPSTAKPESFNATGGETPGFPIIHFPSSRRPLIPPRQPHM